MSNDIVIEAWNTVLFEKFSRFKFLFVEGYTSISQEVFRRQPFEAGSSVLDIGCGFGDCTIAIAKSVGGAGVASGVDCASNFVEECRKSAAEEQVANARFLSQTLSVKISGDPMIRLLPDSAPCSLAYRDWR